MSKEQREEQRFRMFVQDQKDTFIKMMRHPEFLAKVKEIINDVNRGANHGKDT